MGVKFPGKMLHNTRMPPPQYNGYIFNSLDGHIFEKKIVVKTYNYKDGSS